MQPTKVVLYVKARTPNFICLAHPRIVHSERKLRHVTVCALGRPSDNLQDQVPYRRDYTLILCGLAALATYTQLRSA